MTKRQKKLVFRLKNKFQILATVEQEAAQRLATVRLTSLKGSAQGVVDLLFASSGIEPEIVQAAEVIEALPGISIPVAITGHLIALKHLARAPNRPQDEMDLQTLLEVATTEDKMQAKKAVELIEKRGFNRGKPLVEQLEKLL